MSDEPKKDDFEFRVPTLNLKRPAPSKPEPKPLPNASLEYEVPVWALKPLESAGYKMEVIKGGRIVDIIDLENRKNPTFVVIGRLPQCDIVLEHPSMSRFHCIMQYGEKDPVSGKGWYLYDMGSTHGTRKNKQRLEPKTYERVYVGHMMIFGGSSRMMTLHGPEEDAEPELNISPSELKRLVERQAMKKKAFLDAKKELEREDKEEHQQKEKAGNDQGDGISWGMGDDAQLMGKIIDDQSDAHLMEDREQYYRNDPVKALEKFFEREGFDMEFMFSDAGTPFNPKWKCSIELPVDTAVGQSMNVSSAPCSSKKDAQTQCALEACRLLDTHGILRQSVNRNKTRDQQMKDNDYYDSDEDTFYDRTGQIEEQRNKRRRRMEEASGEAVPEKDTYETLQVKLKNVEAEMKSVEQTLERLNRDTIQAQLALSADRDEDSEEKPKIVEDMKTKADKSKYRTKLVSLKHEAERLRKLIKIVTPVALPDMFAPKASSSGGATSAASASKREELMRRVMAAKKAMTAAYLPLAILLLCPWVVESVSIKVDSVNFCNLDSSVCVPLVDLKPNCTCILESPGQPTNRSADASIFVQQKALPADLFSFVSASSRIRETMGERLPASEQYSSHLMRDLPTSDISEEFFFIAVNQSFIESFFSKINDLKILSDVYLSANLPHWCSSGECNFIEFVNRGFDSSNNSYKFISTVVQVSSADGMSFIAVSEVESRLFVDANIRRLCAKDCEEAKDLSAKEYCRNKCAEKIRYDNMSRIGQMKTDLMGHTQAATIDNLRVKYRKFLKDYPHGRVRGRGSAVPLRNLIEFEDSLPRRLLQRSTLSVSCFERLSAIALQLSTASLLFLWKFSPKWRYYSIERALV
ncbi:hypothetical protein QR680_013568 [Steinernema hermaphroditum]|uniref:FHA domain-containing protein n=1 Tax=Steinernema hermaphroditum TaxID=289476 RepID=A0AA39M1S0_9BILA|nr:hypothetical protein QR680_013568 [Steinernema hermaphroditum]